MPAVTPEFANVAVPVTLPEPSKAAEVHVTSPVIPIVRAVAKVVEVEALPVNAPINVVAVTPELLNKALWTPPVVIANWSAAGWKIPVSKSPVHEKDGAATVSAVLPINRLKSTVPLPVKLVMPV